MSEPVRGQVVRRVTGALLVGLVVFAPVAIGTVHEWTRAVVFGVSALALFLTLLERKLSGKRFSVTVPLVALLVAVAATALQLVPWPTVALANLAPTAHAIRSLRGDYALAPLSLEPAATVADLAKLCAYAAFFAAATTYASRSHRRRHLLVAVTATATVIALIGLVEMVLGTHAILGLYKPQASWSAMAVHGTFVNPNHLGALLTLGAPCALILGMMSERRRWLAYAAAFVINVAVALSLARASIISVWLAQLLVLVLDRVWLRRGAEFLATPMASRGTLALVVVAAAGLAFAAGAGKLTATAERTASLEDLHDPLSKVHVWQSSTKLVMELPWTGIGRGAFEQVFPRVSDVGGKLRYQFVENGYLGAAIDWGVPVALLLFLLAAWALRLALKRVRQEPLALGAFAAVLGLAVHEAADFAVELPGVALPALAVLATLFSHRSAEPVPGRRRIVVRPAYLALPALLLAPLVWELRSPSAEADEARIGAAVVDPTLPTERFLVLAEAAWRRHPADYFLCARVAERLAREMNPAALRWLNAAMYLNPHHPAPHVMAAELLAATNHKSQALLEYRLAASGARDPRLEVWPMVLRHYPALDDLVAATPDDPPLMGLLAKWLLGLGRTADAEKVYELALAHRPGDAIMLQRLAELALARHDLPAARARVGELLLVDRSPPAQRLAVRERILANDLPRAAQLLDSGLDRSAEAFAVELGLAEAFARAGQLDAARRRLEQLTTWQLDRQQRAQVHGTRAIVEQLAGNEHQSRWELEQRNQLLER